MNKTRGLVVPAEQASRRRSNHWEYRYSFRANARVTSSLLELPHDSFVWISGMSTGEYPSAPESVRTPQPLAETASLPPFGNKAAKNRAPARKRTRHSLTKRQHACLVLVAKGKTDRQVGDALGISPQTAHKHIEAAKRRFEVQTRIQLVLRALWEDRLDLGQLVR